MWSFQVAAQIAGTNGDNAAKISLERMTKKEDGNVPTGFRALYDPLLIGIFLVPVVLFSFGGKESLPT